MYILASSWTPGRVGYVSYHLIGILDGVAEVLAHLDFALPLRLLKHLEISSLGLIFENGFLSNLSLSIFLLLEPHLVYFLPLLFTGDPYILFLGVYIPPFFTVFFSFFKI